MKSHGPKKVFHFKIKTTVIINTLKGIESIRPAFRKYGSFKYWHAAFVSSYSSFMNNVKHKSRLSESHNCARCAKKLNCIYLPSHIRLGFFVTLRVVFMQSFMRSKINIIKYVKFTICIREELPLAHFNVINAWH